ncbi:DNA adenine methylase [Isachenkonia alkalipeptolytica]|uniref:DNA adenine methylase n=1 Tax=Isachenkonia alkalipeptolytica TaxID=2565777 RepID=UPI00136A7FE1
MADYSPLRYPGGKAKLYKEIKQIITDNNLEGCTYVEPFAGGAGLALNLLIRGDVGEIILNDYDRSIYAFWYSCLHHTQELINRINDTEVTIPNWVLQKKVQENKEQSTLLDLGFSTFFLNRVNRSGIIKGGVIGGIEQKGQYKIDCRFNKTNLVQRIEKIAEHRNRIEIYNLDGVDFINKKVRSLAEHSLTFFDPPYYKKAEGLYTNFYIHEDHVELKNAIQKNVSSPYLITYDNQEEIVEIYSDMIMKEYDITYCASIKRSEKEVMIYHGLEMQTDN